MAKAKLIPYTDHRGYSEDEMQRRARAFCDDMRRRRSVRAFSDRAVPREVIEDAIRAAITAPSGGNMQPWHFVVVTDPMVKREIRQGAEAEERELFSGRAGVEWLRTVEHEEVAVEKPYLEVAPYLIVAFQKNYAMGSGQERVRNYYLPESIGIATGILITALHTAGLATLVHTPRPMGFLRRVLQRPANERASMIVVAGYPVDGATVPAVAKKPFSQVVTFI